jgi:hypothetical protein
VDGTHDKPVQIPESVVNVSEQLIQLSRVGHIGGPVVDSRTIGVDALRYVPQIVLTASCQHDSRAVTDRGACDFPPEALTDPNDEQRLPLQH